MQKSQIEEEERVLIAVETRKMSSGGTRKRKLRSGERRKGVGERRPTRREESMEQSEQRIKSKGEKRSSFCSLVGLLIKVNPTVRGDGEEGECARRGEQRMEMTAGFFHWEGRRGGPAAIEERKKEDV